MSKKWKQNVRLSDRRKVEQPVRRYIPSLPFFPPVFYDVRFIHLYYLQCISNPCNKLIYAENTNWNGSHIRLLLSLKCLELLASEIGCDRDMLRHDEARNPSHRLPKQV